MPNHETSSGSKDSSASRGNKWDMSDAVPFKKDPDLTSEGEDEVTSGPEAPGAEHKGGGPVEEEGASSEEEATPSEEEVNPEEEGGSGPEAEPGGNPEEGVGGAETDREETPAEGAEAAESAETAASGENPTAGSEGEQDTPEGDEPPSLEDLQQQLTDLERDVKAKKAEIRQRSPEYIDKLLYREAARQYDSTHHFMFFRGRAIKKYIKEMKRGQRMIDFGGGVQMPLDQAAQNGLLPRPIDEANRLAHQRAREIIGEQRDGGQFFGQIQHNYKIEDLARRILNGDYPYKTPDGQEVKLQAWLNEEEQRRLRAGGFVSGPAPDAPQETAPGAAASPASAESTPETNSEATSGPESESESESAASPETAPPTPAADDSETSSPESPEEHASGPEEPEEPKEPKEPTESESETETESDTPAAA